MSEPKEKPEIPKPEPGKRFVLFRNKETRTLHASFVLPDGYTEVLDTRNTALAKASGRARSRLRELIKERGLKTGAEELRAKGGLTGYQKTKANNEARALGEPLPYPSKRRGRPPGDGALAAGPKPVSTGFDTSNGEWRPFAARVEQRYMLAFMRVQELLLLGAADNPERFVAHLRALVIETMEGARKARGRLGG